jgi:hypothetical protein
MKYIKLYESFNTQDIKDILLEVEDLGYGTKIILLEDETGNYGDHEGIMIIAPSRGSIKYIEIEDCLLRLKDYLGDRYIECKVFNLATNRWSNFPLSDDVLHSGMGLGEYNWNTNRI